MEAPASPNSPLVAGLLPWKGLLRASGPDAVPFLHRLLSCDLNPLPPGGSVLGCFLTPQGRAIAAILALRTEGEVLLEVEAGFSPALSSTLERYRFAEAVEFADLSDEAAWLVLLGPKAPDALRALGISDAPSPGRHLAASNLAGVLRVLRSD